MSNQTSSNKNEKQTSKNSNINKKKTPTSSRFNNQKTKQENETEINDSKQKPKTQSKFIRHVWWVDALLFIGGTILLGGLATLLGGKMFEFADYKMPPGMVPKIVFPIAWSIIYIAIGVSTFLMWRDKEIKSNGRKINLILYFIHMFFNVLWPLFFFRLNLPIVSVIWLLFVVASASIVMYRYFVANLPAGIIFTIYTLWLIYALYLNLGLVLLNF